MASSFDVEVHDDTDGCSIYVNGLLHANWFWKHYRGMQSYNNGNYTIDILLKDQTLNLEYDTRERWEAVLSKLQEI